ncbi:hypothetical protein [Acinetobacter soli]|uniref:hypothetical protein n=1 Tax=Acinetobacter soli TaxID=487316 RepID=UPI0032B616E4
MVDVLIQLKRWLTTFGLPLIVMKLKTGSFKNRTLLLLMGRVLFRQNRQSTTSCS